MDFLPADLYALVPEHSTMTDRETIAFLRERIGKDRLKNSLVDHFFKLGKAGETHADESWRTLGLDTKKRKDIGEALQTLLGVIDQAVEELGTEEVHGMISINNRCVAFTLTENSLIDSTEGYQVAVTG